MKRSQAVLGAGMAVAMLFSSSAALADWPEFPITLIVPSSPGGGTDATARLVATQLEQRLGQPINIVNQGQAGGLVGLTNLFNSHPDGYSIGIFYNYAHWNVSGQSDITSEKFTPIAQYNLDAPAITVKADSPYTDLKSLLDAIKENPAQFSGACAGACNGIWNIPVIRLFSEYGIDTSALRLVPTQGAAPGLQDLAAGGVDYAPSSLPEASGLIDAGALRPLAILASERNPTFPDVPTVAEAVGLDVSGGTWRGVAGPAGLPDDVVARLTAEIKAIYDSEEFQSAMSERGFGTEWRSGEDLVVFLKQHEADTAAALEILGQE